MVKEITGPHIIPGVNRYTENEGERQVISRSKIGVGYPVLFDEVFRLLKGKEISIQPFEIKRVGTGLSSPLDPFLFDYDFARPTDDDYTGFSIHHVVETDTHEVRFDFNPYIAAVQSYQGFTLKTFDLPEYDMNAYGRLEMVSLEPVLRDNGVVDLTIHFDETVDLNALEDFYMSNPIDDDIRLFDMFTTIDVDYTEFTQKLGFDLDRVPLKTLLFLQQYMYLRRFEQVLYPSDEQV